MSVTFEQAYNLAIRAFNAESYSSARQHLLTALEMAEDNERKQKTQQLLDEVDFVDYNIIGTSEYNSGKYVEAMGHFEKALKVAADEEQRAKVQKIFFHRVDYFCATYSLSLSLFPILLVFFFIWGGGIRQVVVL